MKTITMPTRRRPRWGSSLAALGAAIALVLTSAPAQAATIDVDYDVNGSTHISSTNSNINLGPAIMHSAAEGNGNFTGDMVLPGTRTKFKLLGFIPVTADVNFEPTKPTTGTIARQPDRTQKLSSSSSYYVRLSNIKVSIFPLFAGHNCRTSEPVVINADTPTGESFDIASGGRIVGDYSIGDFEHCGLSTWLINQIIPGGGNTIELNLTDGRIVN